MPSNEWGLLEHPANKTLFYYQCCPEPYPDLTFRVKLKRIAAFYNYILVLPCVLLSFLTLVIFWLPPESPAKILLGKTHFFSFITDRFNKIDNAIGRSIHLFVRLFPLYLSNRLTFDLGFYLLRFLYMDHDHS